MDTSREECTYYMFVWKEMSEFQLQVSLQESVFDHKERNRGGGHAWKSFSLDH
jgi:hypothetical protein